MGKLSIVRDLIVPGVFMMVLDFIYLFANRNAIGLQIASVQRVAMQIRIVGAIACYVVLISGLYYFILREHRSPYEAFLLGLVIYGVYESTTYSLFKNWSLTVALVDTLWGGILLALTTYLTYHFLRNSQI
jgi:uncharacterized membrane protein